MPARPLLEGAHTHRSAPFLIDPWAQSAGDKAISRLSDRFYHLVLGWFQSLEVLERVHSKVAFGKLGFSPAVLAEVGSSDQLDLARPRGFWSLIKRWWGDRYCRRPALCEHGLSAGGKRIRTVGSAMRWHLRQRCH
jgi:hypothetical protein